MNGSFTPASTSPRLSSQTTGLRSWIAACLLSSALSAAAFPVITNVVETGGDNEATDTVSAKWTGVTYVGGIINEPVPGAPVGASYTVGLFGANPTPSFVDRNHRWTNASATVLLPSYLVNGEYIMIGNDNRDNVMLVLDVSVATAVRAYLLIDNRLGDGANATPPTFSATNMQWVLDDGWTPVLTGVNRTSNPGLPDEIGIDEGSDGTINNNASIYSKTFPAGTFRLRQADNVNRNMYGVVVVSISPPNTPANLVAVPGDGKVTLNWTATGGAASYNIKRSETPGGPYATIATSTAPTFMDTAVVNGTTYYYVVSGVNPVGESADSNEATATPNVAVTGVVAVGAVGQILVNWDALAGATIYTVGRSTNSGGPYTSVATGLVGTSYADASVLSGRTYYYVVSAALMGGGASGQSAEASAAAAPGAPVPSTSLFAATVIRVAWMADPVVTQFMLEQSLDGMNFTPLATLAGNERSYTNSGLALDTTYFYRVQAMNEGGTSDFSVTASNRTPVVGWNVNFGNAANGQPANNPAPNPPGYLQDVGNIYGDRGNGYSYGWDRDITVDGRWRRSANSPDLRYDTLLHLIKAVPPAFWEIEIPDGYYQIRIVAGDPTAVDSVFQFDVEGVRTGTVTPGGVGSTNNNWADFTVTAGVSDGKLSIRSGPNSQTTVNNNKIAFIDIYPSVPLPIVIGQHPQPLMLKENRTATFSVTLASGSPQFSYQWYRDTIAIADATNASLVISHVQTSDAGEYHVVITNYAGVVTSNPAMLTVMPDQDGPRIVSVGSIDGIRVGVCFDEEIDFTTGGDSANYTINDGTGSFPINPVLFRDDYRTVILTLDVQISGPFTVTATDVRDLAGNGGSSSGTNEVLGLTPSDVGGPARAGSAFTCDGTKIEIEGGGADVWGAADQFQFVSRSVTGDFDASVQVSSLRGSNAVTKAVLVARDTADPGSPSIHLSVNPPPPGRNQGECGVRTTQGGATAALGLSYTPAGVPNAFMRLTRAGNTFTAYRSSNGVDWVQYAQGSQASPATLLVGIGVTARDNTLLATGAFCNFKISQCNGSFVPVLTNYVDNGNGTVSFQFSTATGCAYQVQCSDDVTAGMWPTLETRAGTGGAVTVTVPIVGDSQRFYRIRLQP